MSGGRAKLRFVSFGERKPLINGKLDELCDRIEKSREESDGNRDCGERLAKRSGSASSCTLIVFFCFGYEKLFTRCEYSSNRVHSESAGGLMRYYVGGGGVRLHPCSDTKLTSIFP